MATAVSGLDAHPTRTSNDLVDIARWLQEDNYVAIFKLIDREVEVMTVMTRFFHKQCSEDNNQDSKQIAEFMKNHRIIYFDASDQPELLEEGKLNVWIKNAGFSECRCNLQDHLFDPYGTIPHKFFTVLSSIKRWTS